jgi:superfamily II DNA helicase RecQ
MLPSILDPQHISIVFTLYVALANDLIRHCSEVRISCIRWQSSIRVLRASIIVVVIDAGMSVDFILYLRDLQSEGRLARTYFDEAHTLITERNFRPDMDLYSRISLPVQKIHLTATLPPSMEDYYEEIQLLLNPPPIYIRASSNRVNVQYTIKIFSNTQFFTRFVHFINEKIETLASNEKILIFCKTINEINEIVGLISAFTYHSKESNKESNLTRWIEGERRIMVATSALGASVNIKGIKWVIHVEETWGCIPFIQESGRGGRDGGVFNSCTILSDETKNRLENRNPGSQTPDQLALHQFLITPHCRRLILTKYLDGPEMIKDCTASNSVLCDNCQNNGTGTRSQKRQREQEEQEVQQRNKRQELSRLSSIQESIATKQLILEKIKQLAIRLELTCSVCWFMKAGNYKDHTDKTCDFKNFGLDHGLTIRFMPDSCCFTCGYPGDLCESYKEGKVCEMKNFIVQGFSQAFHDGETKGDTFSEIFVCIKKVSQREFIYNTRAGKKEFIQWLGQKGR